MPLWKANNGAVFGDGSLKHRAPPWFPGSTSSERPLRVLAVDARPGGNTAYVGVEVLELLGEKIPGERIA